MAHASVTDAPPAQDVERELDCLVMIGQAAGTLAHQVNNPLGTIHNAFLLIRDAVPASHPHFRYVAAIEDNIRRIAAATQRFVDAYDPARDRALQVPVSAIVAGVVAWTVAAKRLDPCRLTVDNLIHDGFPGPAGLLRHALLGLLDGVLSAVPADQPVHLAVHRTHDGIEIVLDAPDAHLSVAADLHYAERLVATLGGTLHGALVGGGPELVVITMPLHDGVEEPG